MPDRNQKIVIVADDASMRQAIERILLTAGYEAQVVRIRGIDR